MPPPSSGGITVLQILGILQRTGFNAAAPSSPEAVHLFAEAGRLAFADRRRYLGDPGFVAVPQQELLDEHYLDQRARLISSDKSLGSAQPGDLTLAHVLGDDTAPELPATTHISIVDAHGNAVALTSSIEDAFGSRTMLRGFLLNNQLTDFSFQPDEQGRPLANQVQGGKRPLSSMAPTLVFDAQGNLFAVLGSPGGAQIINYVAQALTALLDWHLTPEAALALPHYGSRNGPTELEADTAVTGLVPALQQLGHRVEMREMNSGTHLIVREGGGWRGAADPRREGSARGN
jgi:gamma-glutamyltranspeptidase/glutathione hydrolase